MMNNLSALFRTSKPAVVMLALWAGAAGAQPGQVSGPIVGYVFDRAAHAVRPVLGIPGASVLGSPMQFGYDLAAASISPSADAAVLTAGDGSLHLVRFSGGGASEISLNGSSVTPERVVFSPAGTSVALIAGGHVQVFSGLPASATLVGTMDFAGATTDRLQVESAGRPAAARAASMALSDDGAWLLTAVNGSVELIGAGGSHTISSGGRLSLVAFAPGSHDAAFADPEQRTVTLLRNATGAPTSQPVWQDASVAGAQGLAFSADGKSLFLASRAGQPVTVFDLTSGAHTGVACECTASGLDRLGNVYRLNDLDSGPLWLLAATTADPRTVFVPASAGSN